MASREHREIRTERIVRSTQAVAPHPVGQLDNNLDSLLEDLQSSVSRPSSSLAMNGSGIHGGNYREYRTTERTVSTDIPGGSSGRIEYLSAANPVTVPSESYTHARKFQQMSDKPKDNSVYKTTSYEYNVSTEALPSRDNTRMQSNINQLDNLLDDLQQVRQANVRTGIDPGLLEPLDKSGPMANTSTRQITTKKTVQRELLYDPDSPSETGRQGRQRQVSPSTLKREEREGSVTRELNYNMNEGTYGDLRPTRKTSPTRTISPSRQQTIQKTTNVQAYNYNTNNQLTEILPESDLSTNYYVKSETMEDNPTILNELDPNLLPNPTTKVTTTIKTYTYELPGTGYPYTVVPTSGYPSRVQSPTQSTDRYTNVSPQPQNRVATYVYKNENYNTTQNIDQIPPPEWSTQPVSSTNSDYPTLERPDHHNQQNPPSTHTIIYQHDTRTTNNTYVDGIPQPNKPISPSHNPPPLNQQPAYQQPVYQPPNQNTTIIYKHDTHTNTSYLPGERQPPKGGYKPLTNDPNLPQKSPYPTNEYGRPDRPNDPNVNVVYRYETHTSSNNYKPGYPPNSPRDEREPLLQPGKFPTYPNEHLPQGSGPPKHLDDLMATFDGPEHLRTTHTTNVYNTTTVTDNKGLSSPSNKPPYSQQIVPVEANATSLQKKDLKDLPKTKNVAGPPVYYPPGHEMFAKKEESAAAYRAQGGYMRASGKYEYESESKSKTKSSSGAAVVPVCLPLCCALPCVIL